MIKVTLKIEYFILEKEEQKPEEDLNNHEVIFLRGIVESPDFARKCEVTITYQLTCS